MSTYSTLTEDQRGRLQTNGCRARIWDTIEVAGAFDPDLLHRVTFEGTVQIGEGTTIVDARLCDVTIGSRCRIQSVNGCLRNLILGNEVTVENVGTIECSVESTFGNGYEAAVLNEGGGREVKLTTQTSAQVAYLTAMYRHDAALTSALNRMADTVAEAARASRAPIGAGATIANTQHIRNVAIGPAAVINGALSLSEGTVDSSAEAPATVGAGVTAEDFIMQKGSSATNGVMLSGTLIGEASRVGRQFSAENSVLFANSEGFHSEVCSIFAGPYTVTHHRSTLLIAGLFSFYNAGSGTNQSNHMYKLGPLHQGILERGSKTGSFSYLLWPSRVGAFTAVIGKHYANFDTSDFPFSYVNEEHGKSTLVPAMNFFTVGTLRDGRKWPARDKRTAADPLDQITFDVLSPYTAQKMLRAVDILGTLQAEAERSQEYVTYQGILIKRLLLKTCGRYYRLALDKYFGDTLVRRAEAAPDASAADLVAEAPADVDTTGEWVDLCGLLCPQTRVDALTKAVLSGSIADFEQLHQSLKAIRESYRHDEWNWVRAAYARYTGNALTPEVLPSLLAGWKKSSTKLLNMVLNDGEKEFEGNVRLGFGIDGSSDDDFTAVRGTFDDNSFVAQLRDEMTTVESTAESLTARFS